MGLVKKYRTNEEKDPMGPDEERKYEELQVEHRLLQRLLNHKEMELEAFRDRYIPELPFTYIKTEEPLPVWHQKTDKGYVQMVGERK